MTAVTLSAAWPSPEEVYVGDHPEIASEDEAGWVTCDPGASIDVPDHVAHGTPGDSDGPGTTGLLDQVDKWHAPKTKPKTTTKTTDDAPAAQED